MIHIAHCVHKQNLLLIPDNRFTCSRWCEVTIDNERHCALIHVKDHQELVRHVQLQPHGVGHARLVAAVVVRLALFLPRSRR